MSLGRKFVLYLVVVHLVFAAAAVVFLREHRVWLIAVEAVFVVSFLAGLRLVRDSREPVRMLREGAALIRGSDFTTRFRETGHPELDELIGVYNRMVDHLREERIRGEEQEAFLERVLSVSPSGVVTLDLEGRVASVNPGAERLLTGSREEVRGKRLDDLGTPFAAALARLAEGETRVVSLRGARRVRVRRLSFQDRGHPRGFLLLDELTEELRRSEKAAYDKLIRMMSHEVNNTSGSVSSLLNSCLNYRAQIDPADREDFTGALTVAIERVGHMNRFMKEFADVVRLPPPRKEEARVEELLRRVERLVREECARRRIAWVWEVEPDLPAVALDPAQVEQALINIVRNGLEAMGEDGTLTVRLRREGVRVTLRVADTGPGISPEAKEHLFTPFFTTKETGQGIGLTMIQEILVGHGFEFWLESEEGRGTEFAIGF